MSELALEATGISKAFAGVQALDKVDLRLPYGRVTALMGENGAGKSTLLKILDGDYIPDAGTLRLDGQVVAFHSPIDSRRAGLRVVAQEPEIVPYMNVAENLYLGDLPARNGWVDARRMMQRASADIERFGFQRMLRPGTLAIRLSPAQRQLVEILRCLISEPKVLCFDEPTSSLSDSETEVLFQLISDLRGQGRAIAYVSHRLREIFQIADTVTVLRDGKLIGSVEVDQTTPDDVVKMMVGRDLASFHSRDHYAPGEVALELRDVTTDDVTGASLTLHKHEVVALAGLVGAGRSELALAVVGDRPVRSGTVLVHGKAQVFSSPGDAVRAGLGLAPEERKADALVMVRNVRENLALASLDKLSRFSFIKAAAERKLVSTYIDRLRVRTPSMETLVANLSGGNQQKVVLARWLARDADILILDEPTRGVDVGAKAEIYGVIDALAKSGKAILVISSELPEVLGIADRIIVMQDGHITGELSHAEATEQKILALAMASELSTTGEPA